MVADNTLDLLNQLQINPNDPGQLQALSELIKTHQRQQQPVSSGVQTLQAAQAAAQVPSQLPDETGALRNLTQLANQGDQQPLQFSLTGQVAPQADVVEAELPDGTILEFPADVSDEVINSTVQQYLNVQQPTQETVVPEQQQAAQQRRFAPVGLFGATEPLIEAAAEALPGAIVGAGERGRGITQAGATALEATQIPGIRQFGRGTRRLATQQQARVARQLEEQGRTQQPAFQAGRTAGDIAAGAAPAIAAAPFGAGAFIGGALEGATRPTAEQQSLIDETLDRTTQGLIAGVGGKFFQGAFNFAGNLINKGFQRFAGPGGNAPVPSVPSSQEFKQLSRGFYRQAEETGGILKPQFADRFADTAQKFRLRTRPGKIIAGKSEVDDLIDDIQNLKGQNISLEAAQEIDEALGSRIDNLVDPVTGRVSKEGKRILDIQSQFRDLINRADEGLIEGGREGFTAWKKGQSAWATSRKLDDIERIIERAQLTDNPATSIKTGFRTLLGNKKRVRGYTREEREAIRRAAQTGTPTEFLRMFGSRLNGIIALSSGELATATGFAALGGVMRGAAAQVQLQRAIEAQRLIGGRPLPRSILPAATGAVTGQPTAEEVMRQILGEER